MSASFRKDTDPFPIDRTVPTYPMERSGWDAGPWDGEPDRETFAEECTGIACVLLRNKLGAWCGYVEVPPGHPWHGVDFAAAKAAPEGIPEPDVHGGATFSSPFRGDWMCVGELEQRSADGSSWIGFDCSHGGDVVPGLLAFKRRMWGDQGNDFETYKTIDYAREETKKLARQVAAVGLIGQ